MIDLNKEEYVCLMTIQTQNQEGHNLDYNVIPFKSMNDVKHAILNVITNNIKNNKDDIANISYDVGSCCSDTYARIECNNIVKIYTGIRRNIQEVK